MKENVQVGIYISFLPDNCFEGSSHLPNDTSGRVCGPSSIAL